MAGRHQSLTGGGTVRWGVHSKSIVVCVHVCVVLCVCRLCRLCRVCLFVCLCVLCVLCVFATHTTHTQHTHNTTHTHTHTHTHNAHTHQVRASRVFWSYHYYYYYSRTTACQPARPPARPPLFNSSARRAAEFCGGCLVFCHIKCPISRVRASRVGGISYICQNFAAKQGVRASRVFWGPYSIIINSAELCILPRRPGYYQSPISRVRPIHVGGISDVLCVCVCFCVFVSSTRGLVLGTWRFSDRPAQK